ncbi:hypothetical protein KIP88_19780 [Bradyrhizobium sp. SRL28]|uniref:hypothetical protein n=1 Tax=Bradyrhizobium sp. SRL28 TaxID=2836178 RepID=UPI001BDDD252|nr:hypothetical protein [Bradyrhizobium sp. SRL28]MBT1512744.1 hypothetical protein [Bradyrhizobium sp. SRL28]
MRRPAIALHPDRPCFGLGAIGVYDKDRKWLVQQQLDDATKDAMGTDAKAFFEAEYQPTIGCWKIGKRVSDRDW